MTIQEQFAEARVAITNTLANDEIQKRMSSFGFNQKRMQEGNSLLEKFRLLDTAQEDQYGAYYDSTDAFYEELAQVKTRYRKHRKLALIAYDGNRSMLLKLKLKDDTSSITGFIDRAEAFYGTLVKDSSVIATYGVSPEEIEQMYAMVQALVDARSRQIAHKGKAQHGTQQRNQALSELKAWMNDFRYAARFALRDEPQLLESVGISVPSRA
ncbi:MAG: hypothetical protein ACFB15_02745 [Cyclobacteriaceae bacterium]